MKGSVAFVRGARIAVETRLGFTYFELLEGSTMEPGDELAGALDALGGEKLRNLSTGESFDVFIEDIYASRENAARFVRGG